MTGPDWTNRRLYATPPGCCLDHDRERAQLARREAVSSRRRQARRYAVLAGLLPPEAPGSTETAEAPGVAPEATPPPERPTAGPRSLPAEALRVLLDARPPGGQP